MIAIASVVDLGGRSKILAFEDIVVIKFGKRE